MLDQAKVPIFNVRARGPEALDFVIKVWHARESSRCIFKFPIQACMYRFSSTLSSAEYGLCILSSKSMGDFHKSTDHLNFMYRRPRLSCSSGLRRKKGFPNLYHQEQRYWGKQVSIKNGSYLNLYYVASPFEPLNIFLDQLDSCRPVNNRNGLSSSNHLGARQTSSKSYSKSWSESWRKHIDPSKVSQKSGRFYGASRVSCAF